MAKPYTVSQYLLDRLKEMGVDHVFGVPGDYAFPIFGTLEADPNIQWIGECNELNGAYAADGYARLKGVGAYMVTCGVGELSASCGLAGSYSEGVPVVAIVGHPPAKGRGQTHHSLRNDFDGFARIAAEFTCASTVLTEDDATTEIDRVLSECWRQKLPVYIAVPQDVADQPVDPPKDELTLSTPQSDPQRLDAFLADLVPKLKAAAKPIIVADLSVGRYGLTPMVQDFAERAAIPYAITFGAKSAYFDETRPGFLGVYAGLPGVAVTDQVAGADLLVRLALEKSETNMAAADPDKHDDFVVDIGIDGASIGGVHYPGVTLEGVLSKVLDEASSLVGDRPALAVASPRQSFTPSRDATITQDRMYDRLSTFLGEGDVFVVDEGTCNAASDLPKPAGVKTITQFSWGAIGIAPPQLVGTQFAEPERRHVMITGDGALQMTAQSLATTLRHGFAPIVIVLNNGRYVIENIAGFKEPQDNAYNHLHSWDYAKLPEVFGPSSDAKGIRVSTEGEFEDALHEAEQNNAAGKLTLIEAVLSPDDVPSALTEMFKVVYGLES